MRPLRADRILIHVALAAAVTLTLSATLPAEARGPVETAAADNAYDTQHFSDALALYERAAAAGDLRSQEIAGLMLLYGGSLYGAAVPHDMARAVQWLSKAAAQGSPMAERLLQRLQEVIRR
jgi:TPR repeat protein